jgi:hypothetical protein
MLLADFVYGSYIKELADRINSIEGKLGGGADLLDGVSRRASTEAFASPIPVDDSRKRPFSAISNDNFPSPSPAKPAAWATEHRPIQPYQPLPFQPPPNRGSPYSAVGLAPQVIGPKADPPPLVSQVAESMQLEAVMLNDISWRMYVYF